MGNGSSKSSVTVEQNNTVINRSTINSVNKLYNSAVVNMTVQTVQKCSAALIQNQNITLENLDIKGDIKIDISQWQDALVDFSCIQKDEVKQDVVNKMTAQIMEDLQKSTSTDVFAKLNSQAMSNSKADFGSFPWAGASSDSTVNQKVTNYIENQTTVNLENVVSTSVYSSLTNLTESECFAKIVQSQNIGVRGIKGGGSFSFSADQKQSASMFAKCVQEMNVSSQIINDVTKFVGIKVKEDTKTTTETDATAGATAESTVLGPIGAIGDALGNLIPNLNFGDLGGLSALIPISASLTLCCCCLIVIFIVISLFR